VSNLGRALFPKILNGGFHYVLADPVNFELDPYPSFYDTSKLVKVPSEQLLNRECFTSSTVLI
jgi:hypothetical protein